MRNLRTAWAGFFAIGIFLIAADALANAVVSIRGVPALGVVGGAMVLLVFASVLNWIFKEAWEQRNRPSNE